MVYVDNAGYADPDTTDMRFNFTGAVSGIQPDTGGTGGQT